MNLSQKTVVLTRHVVCDLARRFRYATDQPQRRMRVWIRGFTLEREQPPPEDLGLCYAEVLGQVVEPLLALTIEVDLHRNSFGNALASHIMSFWCLS